MNNISYETLEKIGYEGYVLPKDAPEKVLQFGEGNFLRAFVDRFFDMGNEATGWNGKVVMVQPISGAFDFADGINAQDGLYTVLVRGKENGDTVDDSRVISACSRCLNPYREADYRAMMEVAVSDDLEIIVSNTTEAGIAYDPSCKADDMPPASFPAKLAQVLHARWAAGKPGVIVLACELIDHNGEELLRIMNQYVNDWGWEDEFSQWMASDCTVCTTLVDTIVPGRIRDPKELAAMEEANGYHDAALDVGEVFGVWVIEGPAELEDKLPFKKAGVNVMVVPDVTPYKKRKVRILNGAHTGFVLGAYLAGFDIVRDCMHNDTVRGFMNKMLHEEIIPTLPLDKKDLEDFASAVEDRFNNPFVNHELMSISLNSTSKWKARNMPSFLAYIEEQKQLPKCLTMSLAAYIAFYSNDIQERTADGLICKRPAGNTYKIQDDAWALDFYYAHKDDTAAQLVHAVLTNTQMWDQDLTKIEGLEAAVLADLEMIRTQGAEAAYKSCL